MNNILYIKLYKECLASPFETNHRRMRSDEFGVKTAREFLKRNVPTRLVSGKASICRVCNIRTEIKFVYNSSQFANSLRRLKRFRQLERHWFYDFRLSMTRKSAIEMWKWKWVIYKILKQNGWQRSIINDFCATASFPFTFLTDGTSIISTKSMSC